jgi:hypothetical protein
MHGMADLLKGTVHDLPPDQGAVVHIPAVIVYRLWMADGKRPRRWTRTVPASCCAAGRVLRWTRRLSRVARRPEMLVTPE